MCLEARGQERRLFVTHWSASIAFLVRYAGVLQLSFCPVFFR